MIASSFKDSVVLSSVSIDISSVPTCRCLFRCRFLSETEQVDDHVKLGHTAHVRAICRDTGNRDDKNCASGPSNYIAEKTIGAIYRTRHKIAKATAATSTIWHNEFKARVGSAADCRVHRSAEGCSLQPRQNKGAMTGAPGFLGFTAGTCQQALRRN